MPVLSYQVRSDTILHVLDYPQKGIVNTIQSELMGLNDMPYGINAIVAVMPFEGWNQEDSIILNKASVERGLFSSMAFRTLVDQEKKQETICLVPFDKRKRNYNYSLLDENGIVKKYINNKPVYVDKGDVIVSKILTKSSKTGEEEIIDCSFTVKSGEEGFVDRIIQTITPNGYKMVKVIIRNHRIPEIGDKFAARCAQKGTCGLIVSQENMPFNQDGICPDLLLNPMALPSRMTISLLLEGILGKSCLKEGKFGDATAFTSNSIDIAEDLCDRLEKNGFERHGWETLTSGITGEHINARIFMAPMMYCRLKHMVGDKIHCLTLDTEVLTINGWKTYNQLSKDDLIATLKNKKLVYEKPIDIMYYPDYQGDMYYIENEDIDLAVTGNHRMWISKYNRKKVWTEYAFERSDKLIGTTHKYKTDCDWVVEDYDITNDLLLFYGIFMYYGWYKNDIIYMKAELNVLYEKILPIIKKLDFVYKINEENILEINTEKLVLDNFIVNKGIAEELPEWVFKLSRNQLLVFFDGFFGYNKSQKMIITQNKKIADEVQQLCLHAGWTAKLEKDEIKNLYKVLIYTKKKYSIVNHFLKKLRKPQIEKLEKDIKCPVFCLQVPSEVFYVRRNGKTCWTANSRAQGQNGLSDIKVLLVYKIFIGNTFKLRENLVKSLILSFILKDLMVQVNHLKSNKLKNRENPQPSS